MKKAKFLCFSFSAFLVSIMSISLAQTPSSSTPAYATCDKMKGMYLGKGGWIFEDWEMSDTFDLKDDSGYKKLQQALEKRGSYLIAVPVPSRPYTYLNTVDRSKFPTLKFSKDKYSTSWNGVFKKLAADQLYSVNLLPAVDSYKVSQRGEDFFYPQDHHWTTSGTEASAKIVADYIDTLAKKKNIKLVTTEKTIEETRAHDIWGSFGGHYRDVCKASTPDTRTFKITVKDSGQSLLEDSKADIGVFGDSFGLTDPDNNFAPFLEYFTKAKVVNYSLGGGQFFGSMMGYFSDPKVNKNLPKIIVVPFQGTVPGSGSQFDYEQTIADLDLCSTPMKGTEKGLNINGNKTDVLKIPKNVYSIAARFDSQVSKFKALVKTDNNSDYEINIGRYYPDAYQGSRTDYYLPILNKNAKSISFEILDDKSTTKKVNVGACAKN